MHACADFELLADQDLIPRYCAERFGIDPAVFAGHAFWHRSGSRQIRVAAADCQPPPGLVVESLGMQVMRRPPPRGKLSSVFLQRFGATAHLNTYHLDVEDTARYLRREPVAIEPVDAARGYAVVIGCDGVLGCGRVDGRLLYSEIPRAWLHDE